MVDLPIFEQAQDPAPCCAQGSAVSPHPCPFLEDVHNDRETLCTCCDDCEQRCADDI